MKDFFVYLVVLTRTLVTDYKLESCAAIFILLLIGFGNIFRVLDLPLGFAFFTSFFGTVFLIKSLQYD